MDNETGLGGTSRGGLLRWSRQMLGCKDRHGECTFQSANAPQQEPKAPQHQRSRNAASRPRNSTMVSANARIWERTDTSTML